MRPPRLPRKLDEVYKDTPNVNGIVDDIVVCGSTESEHDQAFRKMLKFKETQADFFGHVLTENGIQPVKEKLEAIYNMKTPTNMKELQTILGVVNYLNRCSTKLADLTLPLREVTKKHVHFSWESHHQQALDGIKEELSSSKLISQYYPDPTTPRFFSATQGRQALASG